MYLTNNIIETNHSKISNYLQKHNTTKIDFITVIVNPLTNDILIFNEILNYGYNIKAIFLLIEKENVYIFFKWFDSETFDKYNDYINQNFYTNNKSKVILPAYNIELKSENEIISENDYKLLIQLLLLIINILNLYHL